MKLTLASESARRKELLSWFEIPFAVVEPKIDETIFPDEEAPEVVARLAMMKAESVAKILAAQRVFADDEETGLVLAADTVVCVDNQIFGKPANREEAKKIIQQLQGRTHEVWTGVCVIDVDTQEHRVEVERTPVAFRRLTDDQIEKYLETQEWEGMAGAYQIQGSMGEYKTDLQGSITNVIGLPVLLVEELMEAMGMPIEVNIHEVVRQKTGYES